MIDKTDLLNSKDMARFVADGLLRFDELVPPGKLLFNPRKTVNGTLNAPCVKALAIIKP